MNKSRPSPYQGCQHRTQEWLFEEEDDFLTGKVPADLEDIWEEEE